MVQSVNLPAIGPKQVIVLAINRSDLGAAGTGDEAARAALIADLLGREDAKLSHVDLIAVKDLDEIGLVGFLRDGPGIPEAELAKQKPRLEALSGHVLILYQGAFESEATISLGPDLSLICVLHQDPVDWQAAQPLTSAAATESAPGKKKPSDAAMSGRIAMLALLVIAFLTWLMILIA